MLILCAGPGHGGWGEAWAQSHRDPGQPVPSPPSPSFKGEGWAGLGAPMLVRQEKPPGTGTHPDLRSVWGPGTWDVGFCQHPGNGTQRPSSGQQLTNRYCPRGPSMSHVLAHLCPYQPHEQASHFTDGETETQKSSQTGFKPRSSGSRNGACSRHQPAHPDWGLAEISYTGQKSHEPSKKRMVNWTPLTLGTSVHQKATHTVKRRSRG